MGGKDNDTTTPTTSANALAAAARCRTTAPRRSAGGAVRDSDDDDEESTTIATTTSTTITTPHQKTTATAATMHNRRLVGSGSGPPPPPRLPWTEADLAETTTSARAAAASAKALPRQQKGRGCGRGSRRINSSSQYGEIFGSGTLRRRIAVAFGLLGAALVWKRSSSSSPSSSLSTLRYYKPPPQRAKSRPDGGGAVSTMKPLRGGGGGSASQSKATAAAPEAGRSEKRDRPGPRDDGGPFAEFPSLRAALERSDLVGLYFAAAWCPMSTPVTKLLDTLFRARLLRDDDANRSRPVLRSSAGPRRQQQPQQPRRQTFAILYVSSDTDAAAFAAYVKPGWWTVPYHLGDGGDNDDERARLKRHFNTCAKREMAALGLTAPRDAEIPALVVVSNVAAAAGAGHRSNGVVVTAAGLADVRALRGAAVEHWVALQRSQAALVTL